MKKYFLAAVVIWLMAATIFNFPHEVKMGMAICGAIYALEIVLFDLIIHRLIQPMILKLLAPVVMFFGPVVAFFIWVATVTPK